MLYVFIILLLIFFPIPIKIIFTYFEKTVTLKIFNIKIDILKLIKNKNINKSSKKFTKKNINYMNLLSIYTNGKFKPLINIKIFITYGFNDAAYTGIIYGLLNAIFALQYQLISQIFTIKKYDFKLNPNFKKNIFDFNLNCIIFISLANVIYIVIRFAIYLIFKSKSRSAINV